MIHGPVFDGLIGPDRHSVPLAKAPHISHPGAYFLETGYRPSLPQTLPQSSNNPWQVPLEIWQITFSSSHQNL